LDEVPEVQVVGSIRTLESQVSGVTAEINADDRVIVGELYFKACMDGLHRALEWAHSRTTNLQDVV
jgi:hypothetical protein